MKEARLKSGDGYAMLCIATATIGKHRQHIYEQPVIHCERDALLVAYQIRLFSLIEDTIYEV